jgi:hypothetical protein
MQIKNIQQFRTNWRNAQGYDMPNWDENFIGSSHEENSGFYKMVNGIVNNIKADLTPKLQNAQDEQAIYEFLQNAADSKSTECAVIYDEHFFMVLNNGSTFSEKDLKALLNSFQGTKSDKTKPENCEKIGRYGIGFKLAYRLMGKSDGAEELLRDLAGPLVFSWHTNDQFNNLLEYQNSKQIEPIHSIDSETAPWLLKIILACFPTFPNESVKNLDYDDQILFKEEELVELVTFLNKHKHLLENFSLEQGSLFFLRFGPKKHEKLKESLLNIKSGVGYAMNNLKTLEKVALQDEIIEKYETNFERYSILPGTEDFKAIDPEFPGCPIEISLGFPASLEQMRALQQAPSLYQFFPMRNERHSMAYFIHSSSFAKITDRTRLDDQGEANIETFKYIARSLKRNLTRYKQEDLAAYTRIYKALLLTDRSSEYDAELINTHLYDPLLDFIQNNIPTNKGNFYPKDLVIAKGTAVPVEPMVLGIGKEWLYWTDIREEESILKAAANSAKLGLKRWGLRELILEANLNLLNNWITNLNNEDYDTFVNELKKVTFDEELLAKFAEIKSFKFTDSAGNNLFYAINDLQGKEDIFLMSERTLPIRAAIKGLGFSVLEFNILDYSAILQQLESQLDYLTDDKALFEKIASRTKTANLSTSQKHELFAFLKELEGVADDALRSVPLFSNQEGLAAPLKGLLPADTVVEPWLEGFKIAEEEDSEALSAYYISDKNKWEIYSNIIVPFWSDLVKGLDASNEEQLIGFYKLVQTYYNKKSGQPKLDSTTNYIYTDSENEFVLPSAIFYHKCLDSFDDNYEDLRTAVQKVLHLNIPHQSLLSFLTNDPFRTAATTSSKEWKKEVIEVIEKCSTIELNPFEKRAFFQLLKGILAPKELAKVALFSNQKGKRMVLSKLIASDNTVESWLDSYKIAVQEDGDILQNYLAKETDIYANIIVSEWKEIIEHNSIVSNIRAFYDGIVKYARLAKAPKTLITNKYVFINQEIGFVGSDQVFYHHEMPNADKYADLQSAILSLTGLHTPHPEILELLQYPFLKTRDTLLAKVLSKEAIVLEKNEALSIVKFFEKTKENIFTFLYITTGENNRECLVAPRGKSIPYAVEKGQQKLGEKIDEIFGEKYKLLPAKLFFGEFRNKGLLQGTELFNILSKSKDASPDLLSALIMESGNADVQEQVFSKIDKIVLKEGQTYDSQSFEHQSLQIFRNKEADYSKIRSKIYIEDAEGQLHALTDIAYDADMTIAVERFGKFTLPLAAVLPTYKKAQVLLNTIANQLVDYEAPTLLKRRCFEGEEKTIKAAFALLKKDYLVLENAAQLAFALLYAKLNNDGKAIRNFEVHTLADAPVTLGSFDAFHINNNDFVNAAAVLNMSYYEGLDQLLHMENKGNAFVFGSQQLVYEPYIDKAIFNCVPMHLAQEDESAEELQYKLIDFLYQKWQEIEGENRPTQLNLDTDETNTLGGLQVAELVYPNSYALVHEQLPNWLVEWIDGSEELTEEITIERPISTPEEGVIEGEENTDITLATPAIETLQVPTGKLAFLKAIGVHTASSTLVAIRSYFSTNKGEPISQKQLNYLLNQEQGLLQQTVLWLETQQTVFSSEDERLYWLRKLYNTLPRISQDTPLPYITNVIGTKEQPIFEYQVATQADAELFYFDNKQQSQLLDKFDLGMDTVHQILSASGDRLSNLEIKGIELKTSKIDNSLAIEQLKESSHEWGTDYYLKWREQSDYAICLYDGEMPYQIHFLDRIIKEYTLGNAVLHEKIAYVNSNSTNIEEDLFAVTKYNALKEADLLLLLRYKNEGKEQPTEHKVIERVVETIVETVVVEEQLAENEKAIENPTVDAIKEYQDTNTKGELKVAFDINTLPPEMLETLLQYATKSKIIVVDPNSED